LFDGEALKSHGYRLEQAVRWLDAQKGADHAVVEEACKRFDLSPADEDFLWAMWRRRSIPTSPSPRGSST
jgi:hypothetical protein